MKRDRLWTSLWVLCPGQKAERNTTGAKARPGSGAATAPSKRQKWQKRYKNRQTSSNGTTRSQHFWKLNGQRLGCFSCFPKMMCLRICSWLQIYSHQNILLTVSTLLMQTILGILLYSGYVPLPCRKMYWEQQQDVKKLLYAINTMSPFPIRRNRTVHPYVW